jgi:hypothetical protein
MNDDHRWAVATVEIVNYDEHAKDPRPDVFIQWKGTDVCFDFNCDCGFDGHFDGYFAYQIQCPGCKAIWAMPSTVYPVKLDKPLGSAMVTPDDEGWHLDDEL